MSKPIDTLSHHFQRSMKCLLTKIHPSYPLPNMLVSWHDVAPIFPPTVESMYPFFSGKLPAQTLLEKL